MVMMTAADAIIKTLVNNNVTHVFGLPGGQILPLYDSIYRDDNIEHVLVRHEQWAGFMAYGYSVLSQNIGVCDGSVGPGASNLITAVAASNLEGVPLLALTGQNDTSIQFKNPNQDLDQYTLFKSVTKWNAQLLTADIAAELTQDAIRIAKGGRQGAVQLGLMIDKLNEKVNFVISDKERYMPYSFRFTSDSANVKKVTDLLIKSRNPVILVGWGSVISRASPEIKKLAETLYIPVVSTAKAKGIMPGSSSLSLGVYKVAGLRGTDSAESIIKNADVILAIGTSFSQISKQTYDIDSSTKIINVNIDFKDIGKILKHHIGIIADAKTFLIQVLKEIGDRIKRNQLRLDREKLIREIEINKTQWKEKIHLMMQNDQTPIRPIRIYKEIQEIIDQYPNTIITSGAGNHKIFAMLYLETEKPGRILANLNFGCMGAGLPLAIGAKIADRYVLKEENPVIVIEGDGGFSMSMSELLTSLHYKIPVIVCVFNDSALSTIRYIQKKYYQNRIIDTEHDEVDFASISRSMGCYSEKIQRPQDIRQGLKNALKANQNNKTAVLDMTTYRDTPLIGK